MAVIKILSHYIFKVVSGIKGEISMASLLDSIKKTDSGLNSLVLLARLNQLPVDEKQLRYEFCKSDDDIFDVEDIRRAAKYIGLNPSFPGKSLKMIKNWDFQSFDKL